MNFPRISLLKNSDTVRGSAVTLAPGIQEGWRCSGDEGDVVGVTSLGTIRPHHGTVRPDPADSKDGIENVWGKVR